MKTRMALFAAMFSTAAVALAGNGRIPVSAPTMSEWGLLGLGLVVAVAAGITISRRK